MAIEFTLETPPLDPELIGKVGALSARVFAHAETAVNQENHAMAQVNLRHGFSVSGMRTEPGRVQVLHSKVLR